jgi:hypothetical protein
MQQMQVTVPPGVGPGDPFTVNTPGGQMQVTCPPGATSGSPMMVNVPAATAPPVVMASVVPAVPMAQPMAAYSAPQPMQMENAAPQPMQMGAASMNREIFKMKIELGGGCENNRPPFDPPSQLTAAGLTGTEWSTIKQHIDGHQQANGFNNCPCLEAACFFTCCCIVCCPVFMCIGRYDENQKMIKETRIPEINRAIAPKGMRCEYKDKDFSEVLIFYGP